MKRLVHLFVGVALAACSTPQARTPAPPGFWFDNAKYLSSDFLATEPTASCSVTEHGWIEVGASLPDGSWFKVQASEGSGFPEPNVTLARGWEDGSSSTGLILYPDEGIVRSFGPERKRAYGLRSRMAVWMADIGQQVLSVDCAEVSPDTAS